MLGIYCRTSKNRKDKYTIENQKEAGMACAASLGIGFRFYIDDGISGTLDESVRDGLSDLFKDIRKEEITHVYCIDQSRIERDSQTWQFFVAVCLNNNIRYYPGGSYFDLDNPTNRMYANLMSIVNAYYSEITSKKVRLANAKKSKEGKTHGLKAYGYNRDANNKYIVNETEAKQVRRMYELSLKGLGTYSIANILNEERIPTKFSGNFSGKIKRKEKYTNKELYFDKSKVKWRGNVIHDILRNEIYKGIRRWRRHDDKVEIKDGKVKKIKVVAEEITSSIPPIVTADLWDKVNRNFENNKKNVGKRAQYKYLLNGLIVCADCDRDFVGKKRLSSGDNAYKCKGKMYPNPDCKTSRGISINKMDSFVIKHLFKSKSLKRHLQQLPENNTAKNNLQQRVTNEKGVLRKKSAELDIAYKRLLNPDFADDIHIEKHVIGLRNVVEKQQKLVERLENELQLMEQSARKKRVGDLMKSYFEGIDFDSVKNLIHSLIEWIKIKHFKKEGKMGEYLVEVKYRGYEEVSVFLTNWQADNWLWLSNYRNVATTPAELELDREDMLGILEYYGVKITKKSLAAFKKKYGYTEEEVKKLNPLSEEFAGLEVSRGLAETISLNQDDMIYFD